MNQILYVESKKKKNKSAPLDTKQVTMLFIIALIIFGVTLLGKGTYAIVSNLEQKQKLENAVPVVNIEKQQDKLVITATNIIAIESMTYSWNDDEETVINGNNQTSLVKEIDIPYGNDNLLTVIVKGINGKESLQSRSFSSTTGKDIKKPTIDIAVNGNYIKLTVTDDLELAYVTYRWNEEEEKKLEPTTTENAKIEDNVEIPKGKNTFTVIAVDKNNNTTTRKETFEGRVRPTAIVYVNGSNFLIVAKHEENIERLEYNLNGQDYAVEITPSPEITYSCPIAEGYNKIIVKAYGANDTIGTYQGEYTYTPQR